MKSGLNGILVTVVLGSLMTPACNQPPNGAGMLSEGAEQEWQQLSACKMKAKDNSAQIEALQQSVILRVNERAQELSVSVGSAQSESPVVTKFTPRTLRREDGETVSVELYLGETVDMENKLPEKLKIGGETVSMVGVSFDLVGFWSYKAPHLGLDHGSWFSDCITNRELFERLVTQGDALEE